MSDLPSIWPQLMEVGFTQSWVDAAGVRTRVLEAGQGPPLVLLHGTGGHAEAYLRNLGSLARSFRTIVYDLVGHGFTDAPDVPYTLDVYADHLLALLDVLSIEQAHLSGESLGGWVAAWFSDQHPERVARLILTTPGNITSKPETMERVRESTLRAVTEASYDTVRARLEWLFAPENRELVTDELVAVRLAIYGRDGYEHAMRNILVLQDPQIRPGYAWNPHWTSRITAPTLIIWTSDDPTGTYDEGELLHSWMSTSKLVNIEGAGHWPQWERPDEFNRLHEEFLT